jgi:hypothetical protein
MAEQRTQHKRQGGQRDRQRGGGQKPDRQQRTNYKPGQAGKQQQEVDKRNREKAGEDTGSAGIGT